jgi:hypothetical protein
VFLDSLQKIGVNVQPIKPQALSTPGTQVLEVSQQVRAHVAVTAECQFDETFVVVPMLEHVILSWSTIMQNGLFDLFHSQEELRAPPPGFFGASNALTSFDRLPASSTFLPVLTLPTVMGNSNRPVSSCFHPILTLPSEDIVRRTFPTLTINKDESFKIGISHVNNSAVAAPININSSGPVSGLIKGAVGTGAVSEKCQDREDISVTTPVASVDISSPGALAQVSSLADSYSTLFEDQLPPDGAHVPPFKIELIPNSPPLVTRFRRLSPPLAAKVENEVQSLLQAGIISRAEASFVSPTILVPKANSSELRLCVDFKQLNAITKDFVFPLADPRTLLESLAGHQYFATLDLRQGFHQILMDPDSAISTAFSTKSGIYKFLRMPFGVKNGPRYFQKVITDTLRPLLGTACEVFIDDVIVFGKTFHDFLSNLELVFKALSAANFRLKRSKCVLLSTKVEYLGYIVDGNGISLSDSRKEGLTKMLAPANRKQLRSFLGMANFFRSFVEGYGTIAQPLNALMSPSIPYVWTSAHQGAFEKLKSVIGNCASLAHIDYGHPLYLRTDASDLGMGGVLLQQIGGKNVPIAFVSKAFNETQLHYPTYEKELLAVIYSLGKLRHYLQGTHFFLQVDHRNILFLEKSENPKILRWRDFLRSFDFTIEHIPGTSNGVADCLSRLMTITDASVVEWIQQAHNALTGHRGVKLTLDMLRQSGLEWQTMRDDVEQFVKSCSTCQKSKSSHAVDPPASILQLEPFASVSVDTIGPLPKDDHGNSYIIAIIDDFSRFIELRAAPDCTAASAARALIDVFGRFGAPKLLKSDQGPQFVAQLIDSLLIAMQVTRAHSIAYRPQSNSIVERANGEVLRHLRSLVFDSRSANNWSSMLPFVQRILNATPHSSTQVAPAQLIYGNRISLNRGLLTPFAPTSDVPSVQDHLSRLVADQNDLIARSQEFVLQHREGVKAQSDLLEIPFKVDDLVLVRYPNRAPNKLCAKWRGPFRIIERESHSTFKIRHLSSLKETSQHVSMLKLFDSSRSDPMVIAATDNDEYVVEAIIAHKGKTKRNLTFRVRWTGYPPSQDSWLRYRDVKDLEALDVYVAEHPSLAKL